MRRLIALAVLLALALFIVVGLREARSDPIVRRATFTTRLMPPGTPPLRVALVSDIHVSNLAMPVSRLERIVDQINAQQPDLVLIAGDLVNGTRLTSRDFHPWSIVAPLSRLRARLGVVAVLGNHDEDTSPRLVATALRSAGVTVLHRQALRVGPITLIAADYYGGMRPDRLGPTVDEARHLGGVPVLFTHAPPYRETVPRSIPLVLAGHTHCGQIVLPGWDNSFDILHWALRWDPQFRCGLVNTPFYTAIITGGVGAATLVPLRINAPPDFWMITIAPAINAPTDRQIRSESSR